MLEMILKITGMIVTAASTIVKAIGLADKFRHRKSNRRPPFHDDWEDVLKTMEPTFWV